MLKDAGDIFGGIVVTNFAIGPEEAEILHEFGLPKGSQRLLDTVCSPEILPDAVELLKRKKKKCRFLANQALYDVANLLDRSIRTRSVLGGDLEQPANTFLLDLSSADLQREGPAPAAAVVDDLLLATAVCHMSASNTITVAKDSMIIANATGQKNRKTAVKLAVLIAADSGHSIEGSAWCSDSFFPFPDGPEIIAATKPAVVFTTSGSANDKICMPVFTSAGIPLLTMDDKLARGFRH